MIAKKLPKFNWWTVKIQRALRLDEPLRFGITPKPLPKGIMKHCMLGDGQGNEFLIWYDPNGKDVDLEENDPELAVEELHG